MAVKLGGLPNPGGAFASPMLGQQAIAAFSQLPGLVDTFLNQQMKVRQFKQQTALNQLALQQGQVDIEAARQKIGLSNLQFLTNIGAQLPAVAKMQSYRNYVDQSLQSMGFTDTSFVHNQDGSVNINALGTTPEESHAAEMAISLLGQMNKLWGMGPEAALQALKEIPGITPEQYQTFGQAVLAQGVRQNMLTTAQMRVLGSRYNLNVAQVSNIGSEISSRQVMDAYHRAGIDHLNAETFIQIPAMAKREAAQTTQLLASAGHLNAETNALLTTGFTSSGQAAKYALGLNMAITTLAQKRAMYQTIVSAGPAGLLQGAGITNPTPQQIATARAAISDYSVAEKAANKAISNLRGSLQSLTSGKGKTAKARTTRTSQPTQTPSAPPAHRPSNVPATAKLYPATIDGKPGYVWKDGTHIWDENGKPIQ